MVRMRMLDDDMVMVMVMQVMMMRMKMMVMMVVMAMIARKDLIKLRTTIGLAKAFVAG